MSLFENLEPIDVEPREPTGEAFLDFVVKPVRIHPPPFPVTANSSCFQLQSAFERVALLACEATKAKQSPGGFGDLGVFPLEVILLIMKYTICSPYTYVENMCLEETEQLPSAGRLPLYWYTVSKSFYALAQRSPVLHTDILVVIDAGGSIVNGFDIENAIKRSGDTAGLTVVLAEGSSEYCGTMHDCVIHDNDDDLNTYWNIECTTCPPWNAAPPNGSMDNLGLQAFIRSYRHRFVSITCTTTTFTEWLHDAKPEEFQMLRELNVCKKLYAPPLALDTFPIFAAPNLRHLRYHSVRLTGSLGGGRGLNGWNRLTSLNLFEAIEIEEGYATGGTPPHNARLILQHASSLKEFHLSLWDEQPPSLPTVLRPLVHERLQSLVVRYSHPTDDFALSSTSFFDALACPSLREFSLIGYGGCASPSLYPFLKLHRDLTVLDIIGVSVGHHTLADVLREMPGIKTLRLGSGGWGDPEGGPLPQGGDHLCDQQHLCDKLLELLTGAGWAAAKEQCEREMQGGYSRGIDVVLTGARRLLWDVDASTVRLCPRLHELHVRCPRFTPLGLRTFIRARGNTMRAVVLQRWDQVDAYGLWTLRQDFARHYNVVLSATTVVRTEYRDFTPALTVLRKELWSTVVYGLRRVLRGIQRLIDPPKGVEQSGWGVTPADDNDADGWGARLKDSTWTNGDSGNFGSD